MEDKYKINLHNVYLLSKEINEWTSRLLKARDKFGSRKLEEHEIKYFEEQTKFYNNKMARLLSELAKG